MDVRAHNIREKHKKKKKEKSSCAMDDKSYLDLCERFSVCVFHNDSECVVASVVFGDFCVH